MTLIVETPDTRAPERGYVLGVVLGRFLSLHWQRVPEDRADLRITLEGQPGELRLPDVLLSTPEADWLQPASLPARPLRQWDAHQLATEITLVDPIVPVIYGSHPSSVKVQPSGRSNARFDDATRNDRDSDTQVPFVSPEDDRVALPIDIFGSAFFMLTRYEELVVTDRDEHDRFPAWASLSYQEDFLERPIVDEYVEILWAALQRLWPQLERKQREPRTFVTCDVDNPYATYTKSMAVTVRKMGGDVLKRRSVPEAIRTMRNTLATRRGDYRHDPFDTFDWMMDVNEAAGNRITFFFLVDSTVPGLDGHYSIDEPRIRALMRRISGRGHELGLHGSYVTYRNPGQMAKEMSRLRQTMTEEGIEQNIIGARQHYLRWASTETAENMEASGIDYDSTLSFADVPGFRCGTCHEYPVYSFNYRHGLNIEERPLVLMECSVLAEKYMGMPVPYEAKRYIDYLQKNCNRFNGEWVFLWHNSYFSNVHHASIYRDIV